jgi:hypothetical protein
MSIWGTQSVEDQPTLTLKSWCVFDADGTKHFGGWCVENHEGRVSSAIVCFDQKTLVGTTVSGRKYQLKGPSGLCRDADYVVSKWVDYNHISKAKQVTLEELV